MSSSLVQFRVDDELKNQATEIYNALGIDLSTALRMFLKRSVIERGIPFAMTLPEYKYSAIKFSSDNATEEVEEEVPEEEALPEEFEF